MSRKTVTSKDKRYKIATGFDSVCAFDEKGENGYFLQIYDKEYESDENEEGIIVNFGFCPGVSKKEVEQKLLELMKKLNIVM